MMLHRVVRKRALESLEEGVRFTAANVSSGVLFRKYHNKSVAETFCVHAFPPIVIPLSDSWLSDIADASPEVLNATKLGTNKNHLCHEGRGAN